MYKQSLLKEYVDSAELRVYKDIINIRLSNYLAKKYDNGVYNNYLEHMYKWYLDILSLNIMLPSNAKPKLYFYIVPDENYSELLGTPKKYDNGKGSGKPVMCYDLDGYKCAYGISTGLCEKFPSSPSIMLEENSVHELAHLIQIQFYDKNAIISEGLAEAIPLYVMDYESIFEEHRAVLFNIGENEIYSPKEILNSEKYNSFGVISSFEGKSCSFRYSYISSYLFVRGCLEKIVNDNNFSKRDALQYFLNLLYQNDYSFEWMIYHIADNIGIDKNNLLNSKEVQLKVIDVIKSEERNNFNSK